MRPLAPVVLLLLPLVLHAQPAAHADIGVSFTLSNNQPQNGETITMRAHVVNLGPDAAPSFSFSAGADNFQVMSVDGPAFLHCNDTLYPAYCTADPLPAGADFDVNVRLHADNSASEGSVRAALNASVTDLNSTNNYAVTSVAIRHGDQVADLSVSLQHEPQPTPVGSAITWKTAVKNNGPAAAPHVTVMTWDVMRSADIVLRNVSPGWNCSTRNRFVNCTTDVIGAGETKTLSYTTDGVAAPTQISRTAMIFADDIYDPNPIDNHASSVATIGLASQFERVLLPVTIPQTPGAYGSLWQSDLTIFADTNDEVGFFPLPYTCPILCPQPPPFGIPAPHRAPWHPYYEPSPTGAQGGFLYFDSKYSSVVSMTLKIQDLSRNLQTWGTELPIVRTSDYRQGAIQLLDIPLSNHFRQMLRIYDDRGVASSVGVELFASLNGSAETLVGATRAELQVPPQNDHASPLALPARPAYVQIDLMNAFPQLANFDRLRVALHPIAPQMLRYWAFVTVTNNDTQHVTTVTPH